MEKISPMEAAAIALANEVEQCLRLSVPMTTNCVNALDNFRKIQLTKGNNLDTMYKEVQNRENVVRLNIFKVIKGDQNE